MDAVRYREPRPFLPSLSFDQFMNWAQCNHPRLASRVSPERYEIARAYGVYADTIKDITFEEHVSGSRGEAYRSTQLANPLIRQKGIDAILHRAVGHIPTDQEIVLLDALGGNCTVANAAKLLYPSRDSLKVITADISAAMIESAIRLDRPAIRQSAAYPLFADETLDAVIFAYGTHHIPVSERALAVAGAYQMLRRGGRIIIQDFETGTPTERWYSEVLDTYTETAHPYTHFTREGLFGLVEDAGFINVTLADVYDPCITQGNTPDAAKIGVLRYLVNLFGLKIPQGNGTSASSWADAENIVAPYAHFPNGPTCLEAKEFSVYRVAHGYQAEYPRIAIVAVGEKP